MSKVTFRLSHAAPTLQGRDWKDVAFAIQEWIEMATSILDNLGTSGETGALAGAAGLGLPQPIEGGDVGAAGDATAGFAPAGHEHPVTTAAPAGLANANSVGTGKALMRADAQIKRDVRVKAEGVDVATRNALDFKDAPGVAWAIADDPGNDEVDVSLDIGSAVESASLFYALLLRRPS